MEWLPLVNPPPPAYRKYFQRDSGNYVVVWLSSRHANFSMCSDFYFSKRNVWLYTIKSHLHSLKYIMPAPPPGEQEHGVAAVHESQPRPFACDEIDIWYTSNI